MFDDARKIYPGTKRGLDVEFENFCKHNDWKEKLNLLKSAIEIQIKFKERKKDLKQFVPEWKHFKTWINSRCWEEEYQEIRIEQSKEVFSYDKMLDIMTKEGIKQSCFELIPETKMWKRK